MQKQFGQLFVNKILLYVQELLSVLTAPYILAISLPNSADKIIDFFREFSLHVDSIGYVCSFAVFDFKRHGNAMYGAPTEHADGHLASKGGKMECSFLSFKAAHPEWEPNMEGSTYLATIMSRNRNISSGSHDVAPGESMFESQWSNDGRDTGGKIGQHIFRLLDAVYESNRNVF